MNETLDNPYRVSQASLETSFSEVGEIELAGIGQRIGARCIDLGLWYISFVVVGVIIGLLWIFTFSSFSDSSFEQLEKIFEEVINPDLTSWKDLFNIHKPMIYIILIVGQAVFLALQGYFLATRGQTIGKRILNIAIVDRDTRQLLPLRDLYLRRYFVFESIFILSDLLLLLFRLIDLLFLARDDRRTIHDMVANTIVVKV
ncbi:MAG: RDD family protein [Gammaproteobacteria bacterium]|nr:RDD family protein [Gammaproteobacteria bacterium]MDE0251728.1 RDD family protein [Gammaproteobacteria bacterium]MDE0403262.1 RDD family protein [Gammaproteobacteria bacterium]